VFLRGVFSTDQGIDEIGAVQHRFLRRTPENRLREYPAWSKHWLFWVERTLAKTLAKT
jgi:hypothetical protein